MKPAARKLGAGTNKSGKRTPVTTNHIAHLINWQLLPVALLTLSFLSVDARAETIAETFSCTLGQDQREISLIYIDQLNSVPCEIRETKDTGAVRTLWRAENDSSFCPRQFLRHHQKMQNQGWPCGPIASMPLTEPEYIPPRTAETEFNGDQNQQPTAIFNGTIIAKTADDNPVVAEPAEPIAATALPTPDVPAANGSQVVIFERTRALPADIKSPAPPKARYGQLSAKDIRDMDDWLIYLSAQTMSSIREVAPDNETFRDYQRSEQLDSDDIYQRLHNRIQFLNTLIANRKSEPNVHRSANF